MPKITVPFETLAADLHGSDWTKRCDAARMLGQSRDPRAAALLLPDLQDPDWRIRRNAVQALGALKSPEATLPLIEALGDRTATVRERAAVGLGRIKDPQAIPALLEAFLRKDKLHVGTPALKALQKFGRKAAPQIAEAFRQSPNPFMIDLLVETKVDGLAELLMPLTNDPDPVVRAKAIEALGRAGNTQSVETLLARLPESDLPTQAAIAQSLGHLQATEAVPALLNLLDEDDLYGQKTLLYRAITEALQTLSGIKPQIEGAFPTHDAFNLHLGGASLGLAEGMSILNNKQVADLNAMLANMETQMREMGTQLNLPPDAIEKLAGQTWGYGAMFADARDAKAERVKVLVELLTSEAALTRCTAAVSLVWYTDPSALAPLEAAAQDADPGVRRAAGWARQALQKALSYLKDNE
ncbi:MAG: HEAT repeat domain-containing protein [Anaerolineales bacterium]|nr:HEAT repeat domain-containing protein [Anaerolineales bacterium]